MICVNIVLEKFILKFFLTILSYILPRLILGELQLVGINDVSFLLLAVCIENTISRSSLISVYSDVQIVI